MWSSAKDWSAGMMALVVGSLNLMALPRVHILDNVLLVDPLPTELRLRLPSRAAAWQLQSAPAAFSTLANSHTCEADRPSFPKDREATCPSPLLPGSQTHDGCSSPLFTILSSCSQDGRLAPAQAAASCRRSRHRHLRRRGRSVGGRACQLVSLSACVLVRL